GNFNIALGSGAGTSISGGNRNIDIGNSGVGGDGNTIRIGDSNQTRAFIAGINGVDKSSGNPVFIDANGQLGTGTFTTGPTGPTGATGATGASPWSLNGASVYYNSGDVGIGTTTPAGLLSLGDSTGKAKLLVYDGTAQNSLLHAGFAIDQPSDNDFTMYAHSN